MIVRWKPAVAAGLLCLLGGCAAELAGPGVREPGVLVISGWTGNLPVDLEDGDGLRWDRAYASGDYTAPGLVMAPDTVDAGVAFQVSTQTVGPSGCWRPDGQTVATLGRVVVIRPYDSHSGSELCTDALLFLPRASTVVLNEPGEWTLRVTGRRLRMGDLVWDEPISAERPIFVR